MSHKPSDISKYKFKSGVKIGDLDAETDDFLTRAFVERNEVNILLNFDDRRFILAGRTGSGKTAILKYLDHDSKNTTTVHRIVPEELSLKYLSDSIMLEYFKKLNIKMDLFYKSLWEHVIIVELIKIYTQKDQEKVNNFFERIKNSLQGKSKKEELKKLMAYQTDFWKKTEERVKTIEENVSNKLKEKIGLDIKALNGGIKANSSIEHELADALKISKELLYTESKQIVSETKLDELSEIKNLLKKDAYSDVKKGKHILIIDDLDKEWVDKGIAYELIKCLIDVIKNLRFSNVKIIIAARDNLVDMVLDTVKNAGEQREKYKDLILPLHWTESELRSLINKRLAELMKEKYTNNAPTIDQILRSSVRKKDQPWKEGFSYILKRTLMRPRDVIDYINLSIQASQGKTILSKDIIQGVEKKYSKNRLDALEDEWRENYGNLKDIYNYLKKVKDGSSVRTLISHKLNTFESNIENLYYDKKCSYQLKQIIEEYLNSDKDNNRSKLIILFKTSLSILHKIGLVGLKNPSEKTDYYSSSERHFELEEINDETKVYIHQTFHKALLINTSTR